MDLDNNNDGCSDLIGMAVLLLSVGAVIACLVLIMHGCC